jgi:UPF0755 protein
VNESTGEPTGADRARDSSVRPGGAAREAGKDPNADVARESGKAAGRRASLRSPADALQPEAAPPPPDEKRKKKRRDSLSGSISGFISFFVVLGLIGMAAVAYGIRRFDSPGPLAQDKVVLIAPRQGVGEIVDTLVREGVVADAMVLTGAIKARDLQSKIKAGEFLIKANASPREVLDTITNAKNAILHALTIPEGLTSEQIVQRVREDDVLVGEVRETPSEGWLAPDTYKFNRGTTREQFIALMRKRQQALIEEIWAKRAQGLPLKSSGELLTLASIVEKETGKAEERPRVAAVFVNRLNKRMRLQSDPTIIYGLVGGQGPLGRGLTRSEIAKPTPYNTYVIDGLPPGPIANPGKASLEAVANPLKTNDLYFVADGTGGHVFAASLDEHNRNVQRWRQIERDVKGAQGADAPAVEPDAADPAAAPATPTRSPERPRRRGATRDGGAEFGALPDRIGVADATLAAVTAGPDLTRAARAAMGVAPRGHVASSRDWAGRLDALAFAGPSASTHDAPGARAIEAVAPIAAPADVVAVAPAPVDPFAPAVDPDAPPTSASPYAMKPVVDDFKIVGVNASDGFLDPEPDPDQGAPAATGPMVTFPVSAARQADLRARAEHFGAGRLVAGGVQALPIIDGPAAHAPDATAAPKRPRVIDASEGTPLDPLRNTTYDLSSPKTIPANLRASR